MRLKYRNFIFVIFTLSALSCENGKNEPETNFTPTLPSGKEFNISLNITPFLEIDEHPLNRSTSTPADGIYAVNVFWRGKGITSFQPYASDLFDNPYQIEIGLIKGYTYRFDCSFLEYKERPYHIVRNDSIFYGFLYIAKVRTISFFS